MEKVEVYAGERKKKKKKDGSVEARGGEGV